MNILIKKPVRSTIFALSVGALISSFGNAVYAEQMILDEAIDDYTAVSNVDFMQSPSMSPSLSSGGYETRIILEEAYHDYGEVTTFAHNEGNESNVGLEKADIAALEMEQPQLKTPWELDVVD
jgi:hypothetical protein